MLVRCIKESSNFTVGNTYETFVEYDNLNYHYSKGVKTDGNLKQLCCYPPESDMCDVGVIISQLIGDDYKTNDNSCWYSDEYFKEHFEIIE